MIGGKENSIMSRFIYIEPELLNTDHIVSVTNLDNGSVVIELINGRKIEAPEDVWNKVLGCDHIVGICNCMNLFAVMETDEDIVPVPVSLLALTANGTIRALNENCEFVDEMEDVKFLEFMTCDPDVDPDEDEN